MSISHVNPIPGYGDYTASMQKAAANPELLNSQMYDSRKQPPDSSGMGELYQIKEWSKRVWSGKDRCETTYQFQYPTKQLDERTVSAPTEQGRQHKPHPKP